MDNFCTFHQQPHSEKNCPQWINSMTLVMNQLLDSKLTETDNEEEKNNQPIEKQEEDALVLWDCVSLFDTEDEGSLKQKKNIRNKCDNKRSRFDKRRQVNTPEN